MAGRLRYQPKPKAGAVAWQRLQKKRWRNVRAFVHSAADSSLLAFDFAGVHHSDMVTLLAEYGIALRAGQHCAQPLLAELGVTGTLRASFAPYNTKSDVDALVNAVDRALELLVD